MVREGLKRLGALVLLGWIALAAGCAPRRPPQPAPAAAPVPPPAPREFRAAWVATVAHIDWPSARGLSVEAQQAEARELIARARELGLNALIFQVRPAADALYPSLLEPWSEYLTGEQGKAPAEPFDPLGFWIEEAHRAGLELHAWFNPYRVRHPSARSPLAPGQVGLTRPDLVKPYGDHLWLDPGEPWAVEHVLAVVRDLVRRYDLDGLHYDDYFYPYPILDATGQKVDFPDGRPWQAYLDGGGSLPRAEWRRRQVDGFVERLYREVHQEKPQVRVGVSPFGLGRPDRRPPGVVGFSQYDDLYANVEHWLEQGWMDYLAPQLYWKMDSAGQPFAPLLDYWLSQNPRGRHIWPGLFTSRLGPDGQWPAAEIGGQIQLVRSRPGGTGHAHFSAVALRKDFAGIGAVLAQAYAGPALVPATPWLGGTAPAAPSARLRHAEPGQVRVELPDGERPWLLAVWGRYGERWRFFTLPGGSGTIPAQSDGVELAAAYVSAVGRNGLESPVAAAQDTRN